LVRHHIRFPVSSNSTWSNLVRRGENSLSLIMKRNDRLISFRNSDNPACDSPGEDSVGGDGAKIPDFANLAEVTTTVLRSFPVSRNPLFRPTA
jgi:hypothetical protein